MGMGEPLHNLSAIKIAIEELRAAYSALCDVHFSLSTIGITRKLYDLAGIETPISLQVSLHGTTDEIRALLIPTKGRTSIDALLDAARYYADTKKDIVNINYILFDGINDTVECAIKLTEMIGGDPRFQLKLSHYNPIAGSDLNPASDAKKWRFLTLCQNHGLNTFVWESMALDISGGCGQLRSANEN